MAPPEARRDRAYPRLSRTEAASLLVQSMLCHDDGMTLCSPVWPRSIRLSRLDCTAEPPARWRPERAHLTCRIAGVLTWSDGRRVALTDPRADFYLLQGPGGRHWETGGMYSGPIVAE